MTNSINFQRSRFGFKNLAVAGLIGISPVAFATTIDPSLLLNGTDISLYYSGVVLSAPGNPNGTDVYASTDWIGSYITSRGGSDSILTDYNEDWSQSQPLEITFAIPVTSVTVNFLFGGYQGDSGFGALEAFNSSNQMIDEVTNSPDPGSLTISGAGVSYVEAFMGDIDGYDVAAITGICFDPAGNSVPDDASTLVLSGIALAGLALFAWKVKEPGTAAGGKSRA